ncbi:MAG: DUF4149 domain-containing protein [Candidatus Manganitrophaceae bacterium]
MILIWIHILAAMFWIGGMLFFSMVLVPSLLGLPSEQRTELISRIGQRFRKAGWISLGILLVTGLLQVYHLGLPVFMEGWLWAKLSMVILMVSLTLLHDFVLGPRAVEISRANPGPRSLRGTVRWLPRLNLVVGILVVLAAVYVARGY